MKIADNDHRVAVTKIMIRQAFLKLLAAKPIQRITVREICESAHINRGTFYTHYQDVYDLMEQIENELLEDFTVSLVKQLENREKITSITGICLEIFKLLKEHSDFCAVLLGEHSDKSFVDRLLAAGREQFLAEYRKLFPNAPLHKLESYYLFMSSGCVALLRRWFLSGVSDVAPEELAEEAGRMMTLGIRYLNG